MAHDFIFKPFAQMTAEDYAAALRTYRVAMLSELEPLTDASAAMLGRVSKHRERARGTSAPFGDSRLTPAMSHGKN